MRKIVLLSGAAIAVTAAPALAGGPLGDSVFSSSQITRSVTATSNTSRRTGSVQGQRAERSPIASARRSTAWWPAIRRSAAGRTQERSSTASSASAAAAEPPTAAAADRRSVSPAPFPEP